MPVSILPPRRHGDVAIMADELHAPAMAMVTPGEHITSDAQWMRGHGTYVPAGATTTIVASVAGRLHKTNKLLSVQPLCAPYQAEIGDLVVGRVVGVHPRQWSVDIAAPTLASLPLSSINLPGGILRRRTAVDELNMRTFFAEGDLLVAEVQALHQDATAALHTRSLKYGKLRNGLFTRLRDAGGGILSRHGRVVRSRRHAFTLDTAAGAIDVVLGVNGCVYVSKHTAPAADAADTSLTRLEDSVTETLYSSQNDDLDPPVMREITRVTTLIKGLVACGMRVDEATIVSVYEGAVDLEAEERSLGAADKHVGAKGLVEAVLARLDVATAA
ncbi:Exosome complex component rrp4 [Pleosporales sp. CAS-2024a]